jgi:hypothetical protein
MAGEGCAAPSSLHCGTHVLTRVVSSTRSLLAWEDFGCNTACCILLEKNAICMLRSLFSEQKQATPAALSTHGNSAMGTQAAPRRTLSWFVAHCCAHSLAVPGTTTHTSMVVSTRSAVMSLAGSKTQYTWITQGELSLLPLTQLGPYTGCCPTRNAPLLWPCRLMVYTASHVDVGAIVDAYRQCWPWLLARGTSCLLRSTQYCLFSAAAVVQHHACMSTARRREKPNDSHAHRRAESH